MSEETTELPSLESSFFKSLGAIPDSVAVKETKEPAEPAKKDPEAARGIPSELVAKDPVKEPVKSELDSIPEPTTKNESERVNFKQLREKAKAFELEATTHKGKVAELEAKIVAAEAKGASTTALEAKLAEIEKVKASYEEIIAKTNIEQHPAFKEKYVDGREKLIGKAQKLIEESGGDKDAIATALNLRGKARVDALQEVADGLSNFQAGRLGKLIDELSDLDEEADSKRANAKLTYQEQQEQERQTAEQGQQEYTIQARRAFDTATKAVKLEVLTRIQGNDAWNQSADAIESQAKAFFESNDSLDKAAEMAIKGHAMEAYRAHYLTERQHSEKLEVKVAELEKELKGIHGRSAPLQGKRLSGNGLGDSKNPFSQALVNSGAE